MKRKTHNNILRKVKNLMRVDPIRGLKLLEFAQYAIVATALALIVGPIINTKLFSTSHNEKSTAILLTEIFIEMGLIGIVIYYIKKIIHLVPFVFQGLYHKYIPSYHNEAMIGTAIGLGLVFNQTQLNLLDKITIISERYTHNI